MNQSTKLVIIILVLFLVIDLPIITMVNAEMYKTQFARINQGRNTSISPLFPGVIAYALLAFSIYWFVVKDSINNTVDYKNIAIDGAFIGLVIYGIYNATNAVTIAEWGIKESIVDTTWGTLLSSFIGVSSLFILNKL